MAKKKNKFYVVWEGHQTGVFSSWEECQKQINGFSGAKYKGFKTKNEAERAFDGNYSDFINATPKVKKKSVQNSSVFDIPTIFKEAICVDAACSGNPGKMEYRGVLMTDRKISEIFKQGPFEEGTNNIGEYLALVHAISLQQKKGESLPIYSDSLIALKWVKNKKAKTNLKISDKNSEVFALIQRADTYLKNNPLKVELYKWNTEEWGEIPADFGRK